MIFRVLILALSLICTTLNAQDADIEELQKYEDSRKAALKAAKSELDKFKADQAQQKAQPVPNQPGATVKIPTHGTYPPPPGAALGLQLNQLMNPPKAPEVKEMTPEQMEAFLKSIGFAPEQTTIFTGLFKFYNSEFGQKLRKVSQSPEFRNGVIEVQKQFILRNFLLAQLIMFMLYVFYKAWSTTPQDGWFFKFVNNLFAMVVYLILSITFVPYVLYGKPYIDMVWMMYKTFYS